jgi:hypothetical protein
MAVLRWAMLCDRAIIEAETNNLSIINVLDEVRLERAPPQQSAKEKRPTFVPHHFTAVQWWTRSNEDKPEKFAVRTQFRTPDDEIFGGMEQVVDLTRHVHIRVITRSPGFPWRGAGRYEVTIQTQKETQKGERWRTVERLFFKVSVMATTAPAETAKPS